MPSGSDPLAASRDPEVRWRASGVQDAWGLAFFGIVAVVIGTPIAISERPRTTPGASGPADAGGSVAGCAFGLILAGIGYAMLLVAVIAWGVMLGIRGAKE